MRVRVSNFAISLDGYGAGPGQSLEHPLGVGGMGLHRWFFATATFRESMGENGGATGPDNDLAAAGQAGVGAWILGRNMFGPLRGPWPDDRWKGWWGENPPFHAPAFVLTRHAREPVVMQGGTTFHFVTAGIHAALDLAHEAANGGDIRIGGGVNIIRQYLHAGLIDELHLVMSPVVLGTGEALLAGIDLPVLGYSVERHVTTPAAMHVFLEKR
jgi:dihydrofolate reductase